MSFTSDLLILTLSIVYVLMMMYPVMGYIADTTTGRYRMILISQTVRLAGSVIKESDTMFISS